MDITETRPPIQLTRLRVKFTISSKSQNLNQEEKLWIIEGGGNISRLLGKCFSSFIFLKVSHCTALSKFTALNSPSSSGFLPLRLFIAKLRCVTLENFPTSLDYHAKIGLEVTDIFESFEPSKEKRLYIGVTSIFFLVWGNVSAQIVIIFYFGVVLLFAAHSCWGCDSPLFSCDLPYITY
ncbi:hypothetical protein M9H77_07954 [Catharanthus roseus]|uniref:Uncharacterized protein n=1 Tax=Catharanthus roseus TaxID=4058 RepID=A0ACC0BWL6_CATRO|nr:hypothetical protein M9H77_07954 [Catharanthus roseus]